MLLFIGLFVFAIVSLIVAIRFLKKYSSKDGAKYGESGIQLLIFSLFFLVYSLYFLAHSGLTPFLQTLF